MSETTGYLQSWHEDTAIPDTAYVTVATDHTAAARHVGLTVPASDLRRVKIGDRVTVLLGRVWPGDVPAAAPAPATSAEAARHHLARAADLIDLAARAITAHAADAPEVTPRPDSFALAGRAHRGMPRDLQTCTEMAVQVGQMGARVRQWADGMAGDDDA